MMYKGDIKKLVLDAVLKDLKELGLTHYSEIEIEQVIDEEFTKCFSEVAEQQSEYEAARYRDMV